jgi:hypothetical protein
VCVDIFGIVPETCPISKPTCRFARGCLVGEIFWYHLQVQASDKNLHLLSIINGLPWILGSLAAIVLPVSEWLSEMTLAAC